MPTSDFDALDPAFVNDPHPTFDALRATCPLAWTDDLGGFWMLTRHADIARVTTDTRTFVSSVQNAVPKLPNTGRRGPLHFDPPEHTAYRRALNPVFSAERVAAITPAIEAMVSGLVKPFVGAGGGEVVAEVVRHVPIRALCLLLGIPSDHASDLLAATVDFVGSVHGADPEATRRHSLRIYDQARELIRERRRRPLDDDGLSAMLSIEIDGAPLDEEMVVGTLRQVVVAAHVGPVLALAGIVLHLAEDEDLQQLLRADPMLRPPALEELLRLHAPNTGFTRTPTRQVELHGRVVEVDQPIVVNYAAACRDPAVFEPADAVDLARGEVGMAFGHGIHKCVGQHLARAQLRAVVDDLLDLTDRFSPTVPRSALPFARFPEHGPREVHLAVAPVSS